MKTGPGNGWPRDFVQPPALRRPPPPRGSGGGGRPATRTAVGWEIVETALMTLALMVSLRLVIVPFVVDGPSMVPTLRSGQQMLVNRVAYLEADARLLRWWPWRGPCDTERCALFQRPQRGELVVFWPPEDASRTFIKRVIGLPGEQIAIRNGQVYVDDRSLPEQYIVVNPDYALDPIQVPLGHYFVLGDNRNVSTDSHIFGMVASDRIIGRALVVYWPPDQLGLMATPRYERPTAAQHGVD
jgi:signal peptidase I